MSLQPGQHPSNAVRPLRFSTGDDLYCFKCQQPCTNVNGFSNCCNWSLAWTDDSVPAEPVEQPGTYDMPDPSKPTTSGYRGVCFFRDRWRAAFCRKGKQFVLGQYDNPRDAAKVYDNAAFYAAKEGFRARQPVLNFPEDYKPGEPIPNPLFIVRRMLNRWKTEQAIIGLNANKT